ncbi:hypothetical protein FACS1894109_21500 [Spirochaetia bacterium]|nr:hypothetical protein FACS1894109_21500 [Spirochaetia bacterium]
MLGSTVTSLTSSSPGGQPVRTNPNASTITDIPGYATAFGPEGSYWDHLQEIRREGVRFGDLVNLDFTKDETAAILTEAGFSGYRFDGALAWIGRAVEMLG